ncbi:MAG: AraC family transcriptional regulator [Deinococcota bacterium]
MARSDNNIPSRLARVKNYIRKHPAADLSVDELARIANLSPYHFHRVFKQIEQETPYQFVQRVRLTGAAQRLRSHPNLTISQAALDAGYDNPDAFSRAFRQYFGMSPAHWNRNDPLQERKIGRVENEFPVYSVDELQERFADTGLEVILKTLPATPLASVHIPDAYQHQQEVMQAYDNLMMWQAQQQKDSYQLLGMSWDDPDLTPVSDCTFVWSLMMPEGVPKDHPSWLVEENLPETLTAQVWLEGSLAQEDILLQYLYRVWLPESEYLPAHVPGMEIYDTLPHVTGWQTFRLWCALPIVHRRDESSYDNTNFNK